jgi:fructoselysine/glucoselysine PTS system EIID component
MAKYNFSPVEKKVLNKMYWWSGTVFASFNMVKMEGNAFTRTLAPAIDELYAGKPEERKAALKRANTFFNTHAVLFAFIAGLTYAMESEKVKKGTVTDDTIESVKVSLMGPTAGIGDAFFFNVVRVIAAGIAIGLAQTGNILGPLLFIGLYGGSQLIIRWYLLRIGYTLGTSFIDSVFESGLINTLTKAASILGLTMVGAMVATTVKVNLAWVITVGGAKIVVLDVINTIMPNILSVALVFFLVSLIKKGVKPMMLVLGVLAVTIFLAFFKIF